MAIKARRAIGATAFGLMNITFGLFGMIGTILSWFSHRPYIDYAAALQLVIGIGLIRLREWARKTAVIFYLLFIAIMLPLALLFEERSVIISHKIPQWLLAVSMVYFFSRPRIKAQFK